MPTFSDLGLSAEIVSALDDLGFENPTQIQEKAIPQVLDSKKDLIALAQTGTGKTAAFALPIIEQIIAESKGIQCIVLCPTRELCLQITRDMQTYSKYIQHKTVAVYGGASIDTQIRSIKKGCHTVVGTPGRTVDLIRRRVLKLGLIKFVVLDEADEMLTMGFKEDLDTILAQTPEKKQTLLFSATMPRGIRDIIGKYMHDPAEVSAGQKNAGAPNIQHHYYLVHARDKYECLKRLADVNPNIYGIVFCRTRRETKEIADKLMQDGYNADALHGDLSQQQRDTIMGRFRKKHLQILVATDVAARGLDVNDLSHVINYNLPDEEEVYIHRSGRTGRAGKKGISIAIIHHREKGKLKGVERKLKKQFERKMVPTGKEICEKQLYAIIERLDKLEFNEKQIEPFLPAIMEQLGHLTKEDLIKHLVSFEFNRFLDYYRSAPDLNSEAERSEGKAGRKKSSQRRGSVDFTRFHINLGTKDHLNAPSLMGMINEQLGVRRVEIGKIEMMDTFSFFEIDSSYATRIEKALQGHNRKGKKVEIAAAKSRGPKREVREATEHFNKKFKKRRKPSSSKNKGKRKRGKRPF